jgi:hypothetical protein
MVQDPVWPTAAKERIYRYIHTLNLYQIRSMHDTDLMVARSFVEAAGLQAAPKVYEQVANKCFSLLQSSVNSWQSEKLIVPGDNNVLIECPLFQKLWNYELKISPERQLSI